MDGLSAKPRLPVALLRAAKARHRGCVLFGYFLLHKQEKVTRPPGGRTKKHRDVSRSSQRGRNNKSETKTVGRGPPYKRTRERRPKWVPAFAGMTKVRRRTPPAETIARRPKKKPPSQEDGGRVTQKTFVRLTGKPQP